MSGLSKTKHPHRNKASETAMRSSIQGLNYKAIAHFFLGLHRLEVIGSE
jgi:hypothetical protein